MNLNKFDSSVSSDKLFAQIFGPDESAPPTVEPPKLGNFKPASFSQVMALAHNINRRHGHLFTKGCHCHQCKNNREKVKAHYEA